MPIIHGRVDLDGETDSTNFFTSSNDKEGQYTISLRVTMESQPTVVVTADNNKMTVCTVQTVDVNTFRVNTRVGSSAEAENSAFSFLVIGGE